MHEAFKWDDKYSLRSTQQLLLHLQRHKFRIAGATCSTLILRVIQLYFTLLCIADIHTIVVQRNTSVMYSNPQPRIWKVQSHILRNIYPATCHQWHGQHSPSLCFKPTHSQSVLPHWVLMLVRVSYCKRQQKQKALVPWNTITVTGISPAVSLDGQWFFLSKSYQVFYAYFVCCCQYKHSIIQTSVCRGDLSNVSA